MSQHIEDVNVEAFKAKIADLEKRIVELDGENQKLRQALDEASKTLKVYVDRQKEATIQVIMEKADWSKDELDKMDLPQLKLILKAVGGRKLFGDFPDLSGKSFDVSSRFQHSTFIRMQICPRLL